MNDVKLTITDISEHNRQYKFEKAINHLSKALGVPITIKPRESKGKKEEFFFQAQDDLVERWIRYFGNMVDQVYLGVCEYLELPVVTTFKKSIEEDLANEKPLTVRGKAVFHPETGKPITRGEFNKLVQSIEKFLNRKIKDKEKQIVLDNAALGRLLGRMVGVNTPEAVRTLGLDQVKARGYNFEDVSSSVQAYKDAFNPSPEELNQFRINQEIVGEQIQDIGDDMLKRVKTVYWNGVRGRKSKAQIAQDLFDQCGTMNKDIRRIVETESVNIQNAAYINEEVATSPEGEKIYFQRMEVVDGVTCNHCRKIKGKIVLWVDDPLPSEEINDPIAKIAIWPGKTNFGRRQAEWWVAEGGQHPSCRGSWLRYYSGRVDEPGSVENFAEKNRKAAESKAELWGQAMSQAEQEWRDKGVDIDKNYNRTDPAFLERIQAIYEGMQE